MNIEELKEHLAILRKEAKGKTFENSPELFKNIESFKVKISYWESNEK